MAFGDRLQSLRRKNGMTQEEFAEQLKVSRQAVSKWESCRGYPEMEKILYICSRYGVSMDELFADELPHRPETEHPAPPEPLPARTLRRELSDFLANLSFANKCIFGGLLLAAALLVLLVSHQLKGGTDRMMTIVWTAAIILFLATFSALGYGPWADVTVCGQQFLDFFDFVTNSVFMPLVAAATCVFIGWVLKPKAIEEEVEAEGHPFRSKLLYRFMVKYFAPLFVTAILVSEVCRAFGIGGWKI